VRPVDVYRAFALFMIVLGAFITVVGTHDTLFAQAGTGIGAGALVLTGVGVIQVIAGVRLATRAPRRSRRARVTSRYNAGLVVVTAFLLTPFVCIYVFLAASQASRSQRLVVYFVNLMVLILSVLGLILFSKGTKATPRKIGAAVALGIVGTAIGIGEFWYQNQYVPTHAGRAIALTASLRVVAQQPRYSVVRATVTYQDIGGRAVTVIGSTYTVTASRVVRCPRAKPTATNLRQFFSGFLVDPQRARYMSDVSEEWPPTFLEAGKFVGDGKRLEPGVPAERDWLVFVPRHRFQLLRFRAQLFAIPASVQLSQKTLPSFKTFPPDNELYGFWQVVSHSWLHALISGRQRWVITRYELVDPDNMDTNEPSPVFRVTARFPSPTWTKAMPSKTLVERLFSDPTEPADSSEPFADTELQLEAVAQPTQDEQAVYGCLHGA
jgi:hypothetical protein